MGDPRKNSLSLTYALTLMSTWSGARLNFLFKFYLFRVLLGSLHQMLSYLRHVQHKYESLVIYFC